MQQLESQPLVPHCTEKGLVTKKLCIGGFFSATLNSNQIDWLLSEREALCAAPELTENQELDDTSQCLYNIA